MHDQAARRSLAAAALTHQAQRLARPHVEVHAVYRFHLAYRARKEALLNREPLPQISDFKKRIMETRAVLCLFRFGLFDFGHRLAVILRQSATSCETGFSAGSWGNPICRRRLQSRSK